MRDVNSDSARFVCRYCSPSERRDRDASFFFLRHCCTHGWVYHRITNHQAAASPVGDVPLDGVRELAHA